MAAAPEGRFVSGGTRTFRSLPDGTWVEGVSTPPHSGLPGCQCLDCGRVVAAAVKAALERVREEMNRIRCEHDLHLTTWAILWQRVAGIVDGELARLRPPEAG